MVHPTLLTGRLRSCLCICVCGSFLAIIHKCQGLWLIRSWSYMHDCDWFPVVVHSCLCLWLIHHSLWSYKSCCDCDWSPAVVLTCLCLSLVLCGRIFVYVFVTGHLWSCLCACICDLCLWLYLCFCVWHFSPVIVLTIVYIRLVFHSHTFACVYVLVPSESYFCLRDSLSEPLISCVWSCL